jgi:hypothetical protein
MAELLGRAGAVTRRAQTSRVRVTVIATQRQRHDVIDDCGASDHALL